MESGDTNNFFGFKIYCFKFILVFYRISKCQIVTVLLEIAHLMSHGGGVATVAAEAATNHLVPMLSSSESARLYCDFNI